MTPADVGAVFALERQTPEAPHWTRHDYEVVFETVFAALAPGVLTRAGLVAEIDGRLAGFAVVRLLRLPLPSPLAEEIYSELESIVVAADLRGRGIGVKLMNAALDLAASSGAERLELEVRARNPAYSLYIRAGLSPRGYRRGYYSNPPDDAVILSKKLDIPGTEPS